MITNFKIFESGFEPGGIRRSKIEDLSSAIIKFSNEVFKENRGFSTLYPIAAWSTSTICLIYFKYQDETVFYMEIPWKGNYIYFKTWWEYVDVVNTLIDQFWNYIRNTVIRLSAKNHEEVDVKMVNRNYEPLTIDDVDKIISKLNMDDFQFSQDVKKYNV